MNVPMHLGESLSHASWIRNPVASGWVKQEAIGIILLKMGMQLGMLGKEAITSSRMVRWQQVNGFMTPVIKHGTT